MKLLVINVLAISISLEFVKKESMVRRIISIW